MTINEAQTPCGPELDSAPRADDLQSLKRVLVRPPTMGRLDNWVSQAIDDRTKFMTDTIWGTIRWKKSLGRSLGPTLASGFRVEQWYLEMNWAVGADGTPKNLSKWVQASEPSVWDMLDDDDHHQVGYMCRAQPPWLNDVSVRFSDKEAWDSPLSVRVSSTYRSIAPAQQRFWMRGGNYVVLDDTQIVEVPIRVFG